MSTKTTAIILAAGRSRRMGRQKLILPFAGSVIISRVVDAFLGAPVEPVIVVVGPEDREIRNSLGSRRVVLVQNPDPQGDMLSSLRCGLRAAPADTVAFAVSPGDQPSLEPELIRQILVGFREGDRPILVPVYKGTPGHPLVFRAAYRDEILSSFDGMGLRGLLQAHPAEIAEWPTTNAAVVQDLDSPADYDRAVAERALRRGTKACGGGMPNAP